MTKVQKLITAAVAAVTLTVGALGTTPSSANDFGSSRHGDRHWDHYGDSHDRGSYGRYNWRYHWGFRPWAYYFSDYSPEEVIVTAPGCPPGMHFARFADRCLPNL